MALVGPFVKAVNRDRNSLNEFLQYCWKINYKNCANRGETSMGLARA